MPIGFENSDMKIALGNKEIGRISLGDISIYSSGNIVTYYVDSNTSYTEEVDSEATCLFPKTFTPTKSGWTFVGWREDTTASGSILTSKVMGDTPITLYAVFSQNITVTYYNNSTSASTTTGNRYYNNNNIVNPSFTLTQATKSGWTGRGWSTTNAGNATASYSNGVAFTRDSNITLYGMYYTTITLSYNGNGATSGSTANQTGTRYWAPAGYINPSFILRANGFAKTNYTFRKWAIGSASGTQYAVGASVTLTANTTFYAVWMASSLVVYSSYIIYPDYETYMQHYVTATVNNTSYVTMPTLDGSGYGLGTVAASGGETDKTRNIIINYNGYKSATITFSFATENTRTWEDDQIAKAYINGALVFNTYNETMPGSYSLTTSSTSIPVRAVVTCAESNVSSGIIIACTITLKM